MAGTHRKRRERARRVATVGAATATVTAMAVTAVTPLQANAAPGADPVRSDAVVNAALVGGFASALVTTPGSPGLPPMELAPGAPDPADIPDLTFGVGAAAYNGFQDVAAAIERAILDNVNLSGLLTALGYDPEEVVNNALGAIITQTLAGIPLDVAGIPGVGPLIAPFLTGAGITDVLDLTTLLGLDLSDPLNLAGVDAPGLNIITAGPPLTLLKFLGVDLGWVPGFPNSVADEINGTPYLNIGVASILSQLISGIQNNPDLNFLQKTALLTPLQIALSEFGDLDLVDLRIPVVAGFGLGAFAAGMAYPQVVAQLPNQPGGAAYTGVSPLLGSITVLPMILLRNPGRANGGLFARMYPLAALAGIDTVTPDTEATSSTDPTSTLNVPILGTGITLGGANLIPVKVDATAQYDPLSDFPAWGNPVSLLNAGAALLFPTYILRGLTLTGLVSALTDQATPQLAEALAAVAAGDPLALNLYLTLPTSSLPLLEPIRLPVDALNLVTGMNFNNPVATALEPALKILTNLGFTDVDQDNGYERTLDQADVITPFGTLPSNIDWARVPGDVFEALVAGVEQAVEDGIISSTPVDNPLRTLVNIVRALLGDGSLETAPGAIPDDVTALAEPEAAQQRSAPPELPAVVGQQLDEDTGGTEPADVDEQSDDDTGDTETGDAETADVKTDRGDHNAFEQIDAGFKNAWKSLDDIAKQGRAEIERVIYGTRGTRDDEDTSEPTDSGQDTSEETEKADKAETAEKAEKTEKQEAA